MKKINRLSILAVPALASLALLAGACGGDDDDDGSIASERPSSLAGATAAAGAPIVASQDSYAAESKSGGGNTGVADTTGQQSLPFDRKIIFTTAIDLSVPDITTSFTEVQRIARVAGGYVEQSNLSVLAGSDSPNSQRATVTIRVPALEYDDVLNSLRVLSGSKVTREEAKSNEVTEQYVDLQSRLRNLERSEEQYLTLLAKATSIEDILTVNDRLDGVRSQIEQIKGRLNVLDHMTDLATIDVALFPLVAAKVEAPRDSGISTPAEAFSAAIELSANALRVLAAAGAVAAVGLGWLIPVGAVALVVRRYTTKRRVAPVATEAPASHVYLKEHPPGRGCAEVRKKPRGSPVLVSPRGFRHSTFGCGPDFHR